MLLNLVVLALFALAFFLRGAPGVPPDLPILALEALAVALLTYSGYLGSVLVYRNQIGVEHRYAHAGKWSEVRVPARPGPARVAREGELKPGQMRLVRAGERRLVLARTEEGYVAFDDRCTHRGGSLAGGVLACGVVTCPWHGSQFDVRSGEVRAGPAEEPIGSFPVEVAGGEVRIVLP